MTLAPQFKWKCSYLGRVAWEATDETGRYEIETQASVSDYLLSICNGDICRRDTLAMVGKIVRAHDVLQPIPAATVAAFNAWRLAEHTAQMAKLDAAPERYGVIPANDPLRQPPAVLLGARYVIGPGWTIDETETNQSEAA